MGLIWWGIALIVLGVLVSLFLPGAPGSPLVSVGWLLIGLGIVLAIVSFFVGGSRWGFRRGPAI